MVSAGIGVTLIPEMAMPLELRSARVSVAHFPPPAPARMIGMVWRKGSGLAERLAEVAVVVGQTAARVRANRENAPLGLLPQQH
jgi:LysR family hydrogen peroxide-inducible transcriptional activator